MVEVSDDSARPVKGDDIMRDRVSRLSEELDALEVKHSQTLEAFRKLVGVLVGMGGGQGGTDTAAALNTVRQVASEDPLPVEALEEAGSALRAALMRERGSAPVEPAAQGPGQGGAAPHVVLALLEGLRLGESEFDAHLERAMGEIAQHMAGDQVRPAMVVLVDLLEHYRQEQGKRFSQAEAALREVLNEVLTSESGLAQDLEGAQSSLAQASQEYEKAVTGAMGNMVREVGQAKDLEILKASVLNHVRGMRDQLKAHRQREQEILTKSQAQLAGMREALATAWDRMAQVEEQSRALAEQALSDPLTKTPNKRALAQRLEQEMARSPRGPLCLIVFDIDRFKSINDTYGHQAGDRALQAIAHQAGMALRAQDTLFRYAGDEFVILLRETGLEDALGVAERVRQAAAGIRFTYRGTQEIRITVSLGVALAKPKDSPETLFSRADQALYEAKRAGRDRAQTAK